MISSVQIGHLPLYSNKSHFLEGRLKFPNGISEWKMCVPFSSYYWFQVFWPLGSPLILSFRNKSWKWNERIPVEIFHLAFDASHLLQLSTNRLFRVNVDQPTFQDVPRLNFKKMFRSVEPKLSYQLHSDRNFRNFWVKGKQPTCQCNTCPTNQT